MTEQHTHGTHLDISRMIPRFPEASLPEQGSAPGGAPLPSSNERQRLSREVFRALQSLDDADRTATASIRALIVSLNRECAARRVQLRQSEADVARLTALVYSLGGDPRG